MKEKLQEIILNSNYIAKDAVEKIDLYDDNFEKLKIIESAFDLIEKEFSKNK